MSRPKGFKMSEEHKLRISQAKKGTPLSAEHRKNLIGKNFGNTPWNKGKKCPNLSKEQHYKWRGGKFTSGGYIAVYCPNHPHPKFGNYVYEHRLVMEKQIGRFLTPSAIVHHKNGVKHDNRIENLELMNKSEHNMIHLKERHKRGKS